MYAKQQALDVGQEDSSEPKTSDKVAESTMHEIEYTDNITADATDFCKAKKQLYIH